MLDFVASSEAERWRGLACLHCKFRYLWFLYPLQSLEPLPSNGPDFGALGEEAEFVEVEPEAKQEILENKDVSILWSILMWLFLECSGKPQWRSKGALLSPIASRDTWLQDSRSLFLCFSWVPVGVTGLGKHDFYWEKKWVRALVALAEVLDLVPITHRVAQNHL